MNPTAFRYCSPELIHPNINGQETCCMFCGKRTLPYSCVTGRMQTTAGLVPMKGEAAGYEHLSDLCRDCLSMSRPSSDYEQLGIDAYLQQLIENQNLDPDCAQEVKQQIMESHGAQPNFQQELDWPVHQNEICQYVGSPKSLDELNEFMRTAQFWAVGRPCRYDGDYDWIQEAGELFDYLEGFLFFRSLKDGKLFWVFQYS